MDKEDQARTKPTDTKSGCLKFGECFGISFEDGESLLLSGQVESSNLFRLLAKPTGSFARVDREARQGEDEQGLLKDHFELHLLRTEEAFSQDFYLDLLPFLSGEEIDLHVIDPMDRSVIDR